MRGVATFAIVAAILAGPVAQTCIASENGRPLATAAAGAFASPAHMQDATHPGLTPPRDSLKNGAIIGAVVGGLGGIAIASVGCGIARATNETDEDVNCAGFIFGFGAVGAFVGSAIGVGVDAMFEQAPHAPTGTTGRRKGVRLNWRF